MHNTILKIENLRLLANTKNGQAEILRGIDLTIPRGQILGVVGESGSGKSSLVSAIMGQTAQALQVEGKIYLDGVDLVSLSEAEMQSVRGHKLAMIFQDPMTALNPVFTIGTQLADVIRRRFPALNKKQIQEKAEGALRRVGLPDPHLRLHNYPSQLSGGMRQRVMIALALLCEPDVLIADEPTTALDATIEAQIVELLRDLRNDFDGSIIFISHHLGTIAQLCDHVAVMYGGRVVEIGPVRDALSHPLHPYSRALIHCEVDDQPPEVPLAFIPGRVPETTEKPTGCIFASRCQHVIDQCQETIPELRDFGNQRKSACLRVEELA
ncbi:ABC transporter ATP-binding protein [Brucella pseudogrignonensis]|uniref:ABC transporter ATP-binding protein n=1 Tax=Brucella pseudogrignonensis TaxID=419475 RepID=UPI003ECD350C